MARPVESGPTDTPWTVVHRSERSFPVLPEPAALPLLAPPEPADTDAVGAWAALLPLLGSVSALGFAVVMHNPLYLIVGVLVMAASLLATYGGRRASTRRELRRRVRASAAYVAHLDELSARAATAARVQRDGLQGTHPRPESLLLTVRDDGALWERRRQHADFGAVRLGVGRVPALVTLTLGGGPTAARPADRRLTELAAGAVRSAAALAGAPVALPLTDLASVAIVGPPASTRSMARAWLSQLCALHSPADVRLVACADPGALDAWDWVKWLPHTVDEQAGAGSPARTVRTVTDSPEHLAPQLARLRAGSPAVVVVIDGYVPGSPVARTTGLAHLLEHGGRAGITVLLLCQSAADLPADCAALVELQPDGTCTYRLAGADAPPLSGVIPDHLGIDAAADLARWLAGRRLDDDGPSADTGPVRLSDLLAETDMTPAKPAGRRLRPVPLGRDDRGRPVRLDIDEAAAGGQGPHGVLVGATGSGKSELLRSFVAALAATHPPGVVDLLLVDYKGGAAFAGLAALPHTAGLVTNLADDPSLIARVAAALAGELERRQVALRATGQASVAEQQAHAHGHPEVTPLPYLVVVVDEFGELLAAEPELLDTFVRIGRLGRSLGVHLLLASQRLDEGRLGGLESHLRFRIALQTFTAAESVAVLGSTVAHDLPAVPGLGYLKVDGVLTAFRAALATLPLRAPTTTTGALVQRFAVGPAGGADPSASTDLADVSGETELDALVQRLGSENARRARPVWSAPLPATLRWTALPTPLTGLTAVLGLVDEPERQRQVPLVFDLAADGGLAVVGAARSGRSTALRTLVGALAARHDPAELQVYALDLGGGGLSALAGLPHVAAIADRHDAQAVVRVLDRLQAIGRERAILLRTHGLSSIDTLGRDPRADALLPHPRRARVVLLVDHLPLLRSDHPDEEPRIVELATSGPAVGIHVAVTAGRWLDIRPGLLDGLGLRLELRLSDPADSLAGRQLAQSVPGRPGRGLTAAGRAFQLAMTAEDQQVRHSPSGHRAPRLVALPARAHVPAVPPAGFPLGLADGDGSAVGLDLLAPGAHLLVYGDRGSGRSTLLARAVRWLSAHHGDRARLHLVDPGRSLLDTAGGPAVAAYAYEPVGTARLVHHLLAALVTRHPPPGLGAGDLLARSWWAGPEHVLVVDDYDLLVRTEGSPLTDLVDALAAAVDLGWHVLMARPVSGASRTAYDPFGQRLREQAPTGLLLSGDPAEGRLLGGMTATPMPPGRGRLVRPGVPDVVVQTYLPQPKVR